MSRLNGTGVTRILNYIKTWVTNLLSGKANTSHTHTKSQITDFPSIPSKTSQLTNDSGYLTSHQSLSNYLDKSTEQTTTASKIAKGNDVGWYADSTDGTLRIRLIIDAGGENRGIWDDKLQKWIVYANNTSCYLNGNAATATSAGYVQGNNNSANAANALLRSGSGRTNSSPEGDTWIFLDSIGGSDAPWGFKHNQGANTIGFYGAGTETSSINLSTGHFSGSAGSVAWNNVSGKPSTFMPSSHTHTKSQITDFPTIPTVNNATLTIQKNGSNVATFTSNASSNVTANISVPTKVSQLTNDSGFITSEIDSSGTGWVRFKSGVQICWGQTSCSIDSEHVSQIGTNASVYWGASFVNFGSAFKADTSPCCTLAVIDTINGVYGQGIMSISNAHVEIEIYGPNCGSLDVQYIAIGRWK